jgi:hypothetical protein
MRSAHQNAITQSVKADATVARVDDPQGQLSL